MRSFFMNGLQCRPFFFSSCKLNGSANRVTEHEYWARKKGQAALDQENAALAAEGKPTKPTRFETDKEKLRRIIRKRLRAALMQRKSSAAKAPL